VSRIDADNEHAGAADGQPADIAEPERGRHGELAADGRNGAPELAPDRAPELAPDRAPELAPDRAPELAPDVAQAREPNGADEPEPDQAPGLDPELQARRQAALAHVRQFGDPVLRSRARPVERFDRALREEVQRMGGLMHQAMGVGLAATQVGVLHRVLVYRVQADSPIVGLVNPEVEWSGREAEAMEEGCLSLPAVHLEVERPIFVRVSAQDLDGAPLTIEASGFEARVLQHEIDHLDGVLIVDRVPREQRKQAIRAMREAQEAAAAAA